MRRLVNRKIKVVIRGSILVFLSALPIISFSQGCDCPSITENCGPCSGGLTSLTVRYTGFSSATVEASDQKGTLFIGILDNNETFLLVGTSGGGKFTGNDIELKINNVFNASINTNCSSMPAYVGNVYGDFTIIAGQSQDGGALCCAPGTQDSIPPVLQNCPENIAINLSETNCSSVVTWQAPIATDNCEVLSLTSNYSSGESFPLGETEVKYTAGDIFGNKITCIFTVTISDTSTPEVVGCPEQITIEGDVNGEAVATWEEPEAAACTALTVTKSHAPGSSFPIGSTPVLYTFSDGLGNTSTCAFNVVVTAGEYPLEVAPALTPDSDGINDVWTISNIERFPTNTVVIVDRWGNTIFAVSGYDNTNTVWDGKNTKGDIVATGTYFYSIRISDAAGATIHKKGFIEVVR